MLNKKGWEGVSVGKRSRAATIRRKEKNRRDKYKRQFTEPRLWEKTSVSLYFHSLLSWRCVPTANGKWAKPRVVGKVTKNPREKIQREREKRKKGGKKGGVQKSDREK